MTEQASLWQEQQQSSDFAELCSALFEREISQLASIDNISAKSLQGRLKSLPYYIKRTAHLMMQSDTPLNLDVQNASWSAKQALHMPLTGQEINQVTEWYAAQSLVHGLVVPIAESTHIVLDSIDRIDVEKQRFRTNIHGWFSLIKNNDDVNTSPQARLLKPTKKVMTAACSGHCWVNDNKANPIIPTLRELLLSCAINWRNFKQPVAF